MSKAAHTGEAILILLGHFKFANKFHGDLSQSIIGPSHEPIDSSIVNKSRVHTAVVTESLADWAHANGNVKVVLYSVKEELLDSIRSVKSTTGLLVGLSALFSDLCHFVRRIEVRDNTRA